MFEQVSEILSPIFDKRYEFSGSHSCSRAKIVEMEIRFLVLLGFWHLDKLKFRSEPKVVLTSCFEAIFPVAIWNGVGARDVP